MDHRVSRLLVTTDAGTFTVVFAAPTTDVEGALALPLCVMLHGFPDLPEPSFTPLALQLIARNYRVAMVHMRGYESATVQGSARWHGYSCLELGEDVLAVLSELLDRRMIHPNIGVVLIGHDWGSLAAQSAAATLYAAHYEAARGDSRGIPGSRMPKSLIKGLVLLAVPPAHVLPMALLRHPTQLMYSWYCFAALLPMIAEWLMRRGLVSFLWRTWSPTWESQMANDHAQAVQIHLANGGRPRNVLPPPTDRLDSNVLSSSSPASAYPRGSSIVAALGYYRSLFNVCDQRSRLSLVQLCSNDTPFLAARSIPTLALNGSDDRCILPSLFRHCAAEVRHLHGKGVRHVELPRVGHWLHLEDPVSIGAAIDDFVLAVVRRQK